LTTLELLVSLVFEVRLEVSMRVSLIIHGKRLEVHVRSLHDSVALHDKTAIGKLAAEYVPAGPRRLDLEGVTPDGSEIVGAFRVTCTRTDGALEVEPWTDVLEVGVDTQHEA